ncbi:hypothetical protein D3C86_1700980 [compost metagenome]
MRAAFFLRAPHHRLDHLATDRPNRRKQLRRDIQLLDFLAVGVSDITGLEPRRAAGNAGNRLADPAAGTGLGGSDVGIENLQAPAKFSGQLGDFFHGPLLKG